MKWLCDVEGYWLTLKILGYSLVILLSVHPSIHLPSVIHPSTYLCTYLSIYLYNYPCPNFLSFYRSIYWFLHPSTILFSKVFIRLSHQSCPVVWTHRANPPTAWLWSTWLESRRWVGLRNSSWSVEWETPPGLAQSTQNTTRFKHSITAADRFDIDRLRQLKRIIRVITRDMITLQFQQRAGYIC